MGLLAEVTTGKIKKPSMDLIYGGPGVGKTTWASEAPKPIFLPTEEGTNNLDVARFPLMRKFSDVMAAIDELQTTEHAYKSLVIDSLDHLELLIWDQTIIDHRIKDRADFIAYARGYELALPLWQKFVQALKLLREKMNIILICHSQVKTVNDPLQSSAYDRHDVKLHKKAAALIIETCDSVLFAAFEVHVKDSKTGKAKAYGEGKRVLFTQGMPGHEGKNRDGLPYELPLSYEDFFRAKEAHQPEKPSQMIEEIKRRLPLLQDKEAAIKAEALFKEAGSDAEKLAKILNRLRTLTEGK